MREIKWKETWQEREYGKKRREHLTTKNIAIECRGSVSRKHAGDPAERTDQHSCLMNTAHSRNSKEHKKNIVNWSIYTKQQNYAQLLWTSTIFLERKLYEHAALWLPQKGDRLIAFLRIRNSSGAEKIKTRTVFNFFFSSSIYVTAVEYSIAVFTHP